MLRDIGGDANDLEIVSAVIAIGRKLGLSVIAEGVENKLQADFLIAEGCTLAQGFLYGRPMSPDELERRAATTDGGQRM